VNSRVLILPCLALSAVIGYAQSQAKVGIIHIQNAIISTKDGQKAAADLQARFEPRRKEIQAKQTEIQSLRDQLSRGSNTMSDDAKQALIRDIDQKTRSANRVSEDAQADFEQDQNRVFQELGQRMMAVLNKYSIDNGFVLILDVSSAQTPVLYASTSIDITNEIVALYDKSSAGAAPAAASGVARPAAPAGKKK
jgi:outer membrane protein